MERSATDCYRLTLNIGVDGEREEILPLSDLVDDWEILTDDEFGNALYEAWHEWAWNYIDGGISRTESPAD